MKTLNRKRFHVVCLLMLVIQTACTDAIADSRQKEPEKKWLFEKVKAYADVMIEKGRDKYGEKHSPLFFATLERNPVRPGSLESFGEIPGVRESDRALFGANPQEDKALYSILYKLTELTGNEKYANEADKALEFFFKNAQSPETGLMAWGEHIYWNFYEETMGGNDIHEIKGEWPFWDQCYQLAPEASWRFAIGLWNHQVDDKETGDFSRHARWSTHETFEGYEFPRYAGQMILNWADAYSREENVQKRERSELLKAISVIVSRMEENMKLTESGYLIAGRTEKADHFNIVWMDSNLELARCLWEAAPKIAKADKELAVRMRKLAIKQDKGFHKAPHEINAGGGFAATLHSKTGMPRTRGTMNKSYTDAWATGYGHSTHANLANLNYSRYKQLLDTHPELAEKYKRLVVAAAEQYLSSKPDVDQLQKPDALYSVIELMLNAHNFTGEEKFIIRAEYFSKVGVDLFLNDEHPLPKATNKHPHYETITGGPDFMYALLKLYVVSNNI